MARIITNRHEAMAYNGRDAEFVRNVIDGQAFDPNVDQVVVKIDGNELYFFASEVQLSDEEQGAADKATKEARKAKDEAREHSRKATAAKRQMLKEASSAKGDVAKQAQKDAAENQAKPQEPPGDERTRFNRLPTDPPLRPQTDHAPLDTSTAPHPSGQPPGERFVEHPLPSGAQMGGDAVPPPDRPPQPKAPEPAAASS